jgi:hypothetical protein
MNAPIKKTRKAIQRRGAEKYLLITLLSFAGSVSGTRLFLELTGYPQIGNGELHIAHVLWGGLFLFVASILPLIFANRWVYSVSALGAGIGVGLFIDEVGKFITRTNDYFYPTAAPIIYAFFLITVLLYLRTRRVRKQDARSYLYDILIDMGEVLDHDLSIEEQKEILNKLDKVITQSDPPILAQLGQNLKEFLTSSEILLVEEKPSWLIKIVTSLLRLERKYFSHQRFRIALIVAFAVWGAWTMAAPISFFLALRSQDQLAKLIADLVANRLVRNASGLNWFEAHIILSGLLAILLVLVAILLALKKDKQAFNLGSVGLLLSLTGINLLLFYFDQFSTIINASVEFLLLLGLIRYRNLYIKKIIP